MKKSTLWALLVSVMVFLICLPAAAYADDTPTFEFEGEARYYIGTNMLWKGFENEGNKIIVGDRVYVCKQMSIADHDYVYFLNGEVSKYDNGNYKYAYLETSYSGNSFKESTMEFAAELKTPYDENGEENERTLASGTIPARAYPLPVSLEYSGNTVSYREGSEYVQGFWEDGNIITINYDDGETTDTYIYKAIYDEYGTDYGNYYLNGEVPVDEDGNPDTSSSENKMNFWVEKPEGGIPAGTKELPFQCAYEYGYSDVITVEGTLAVEQIPEIESFEYDGKPLVYYEGDDVWDDGYTWADHFEEAGNKLIIHYNNDTTAEYIYTRYKYYVSEEDFVETGDYVLNGEVVLDDNNNPENSLLPSVKYKLGDDTATIYLGDDKNNTTEVPCKRAPKPVGLKYEGCDLFYHPEGNEAEGLFTVGNKISIVYDDDSVDEYICKGFTDDGYARTGYFLDGEVLFNGLYYDTLNVNIIVPDDGFAVGTKKIGFSTVYDYGHTEITVTGELDVLPAPEPTAVEFVPAREDFVPETLAGKSHVGEEAFEEDGNKFIVTYRDGSTKEYIYVPDTEENSGGFVENGDYYAGNFGFNVQLDDCVKKGLNKITFYYKQIVEVDGKAKEVSVPFTATVKATKEWVRLEFRKAAAYTGKARKPAGKLYDSNDKALPADSYTIVYPKAIKVGSYEATPVFNEDYENYEEIAEHYVIDDESIGEFSIIPKKVTLSKVTSGKKSFTAYWKKVTAQASGYQIQYALNKNFTKGKKTVTVTSYKTARKAIKKLKAKKKYYVRVRAYKKVDGEKYFGAWSKIKSVKTK